MGDVCLSSFNVEFRGCMEEGRGSRGENKDTGKEMFKLILTYDKTGIRVELVTINNIEFDVRRRRCHSRKVWGERYSIQKINKSTGNG